jgi:glycosyltransferase involved in cell wall biosynthesis
MSADCRSTISIIIAVRNGASSLQACLGSIFDQDHRPFEVIVIDGASTDGTVAILERNAPRLAYWASEPDGGIYSAWNKAIPHATGDWLLFLGADDTLAASDVLGRICPALEGAIGHHRLVYATLDVVSNDGVFDHSVGRPWAESRDEMRVGMAMPHSATFHHRSLFERYGGFDESFKIAGDYEFMLRDVLQLDPLFVPGLTLVRKGAGGVSDRRANLVLMARENHRAQRMHGVTNTPEWRAPVVIRRKGRALIRGTFGTSVEDSVVAAYRAVRHPFRGPRSGG